MPGPTITRHLEAGTEDVFNEIAQIFRHDFVLYAGMLQSWSSLFELRPPTTGPSHPNGSETRWQRHRQRR